MIRLKIGLEIRHRGVISLRTIEDKTAVVVVASCSRNPVRFNALLDPLYLPKSKYPVSQKSLHV